MKAISLEPKAYIVEEERGLTREEQTIFWIKPKTHHESNLMTARYGATYVEDRKGFRKYNTGRLDAADVEEWLNTVVKIDNFGFPEEFFKKYPELKDRANEEGYISDIKEDWLRIEVLKRLPADVVNEIWTASADYSKLTSAEKND